MIDKFKHLYIKSTWGTSSLLHYPSTKGKGDQDLLKLSTILSATVEVSSRYWSNWSSLQLLTVLKCHFHSSTTLNNKGKLLALLAYLYHWSHSTVVFEFCIFQMSKSGIRWKHVADTIQLRRISHPVSPTYKEGPSGRANGRATHNAYKGPSRVTP